MLAAGSLGGVFVHTQLVRALRTEPAHAAGIGQLGTRFGMLAQAGALLLLVSGVLLLGSRGWADVGQPWLSFKLGIFVALLLNGVLVARPTGARLGAVLGARSLDAMALAEPLLRRLAVFHAVQASGLAIIIALAVFGPS